MTHGQTDWATFYQNLMFGYLLLLIGDLDGLQRVVLMLFQHIWQLILSYSSNDPTYFTPLSFEHSSSYWSSLHFRSTCSCFVSNSRCLASEKDAFAKRLLFCKTVFFLIGPLILFCLVFWCPRARVSFEGRGRTLLRVFFC